MVKGNNEWGEQTLVCCPLQTRITRISTKAPRSPLVASQGRSAGVTVLWSQLPGTELQGGCSGEGVKEPLGPEHLQHARPRVSWGAGHGDEEAPPSARKKSAPHGENRPRYQH